MSARTTAVLRDVEDTIARLAGDVRADRLLDIGCWDGSATTRYALACGAHHALGVEYFPEPAESARSRGIEVSELDLERGRLPHESGTIDLIICNQVFEHLKSFRSPPLSRAPLSAGEGGVLLADSVRCIRRAGGPKMNSRTLEAPA